MSDYIKLKESIKETRLPDFYFRFQIIGTKTKLNQDKVTGLTTLRPEILTINSSLYDALFLGLQNDDDQLRLAHVIEARLRAIFRQNTRDIEKETNLQNDVTLPGLFDCEIITPRGTNDIPDIYVEWTQTIGEFKIRVKSREDAKSFVLECTQYAEDGSIVSVTERSMDYATETLNGFVSGANYMFRAYTVLPNKARTDWTGYFAIRAK